MELVATLSGHTDGVNTLAVLDDGARLASGSHDRTIRVRAPQVAHTETRTWCGPALSPFPCFPSLSPHHTPHHTQPPPTTTATRSLTVIFSLCVGCAA